MTLGGGYHENKCDGWVKLYRSLKKKGWYTNSQCVHLWIHLLIQANHSGKEVVVNKKELCPLPGVFLTSRPRLSKETGISQSQIERTMNMFESSGQIEQQKTNKYRWIIIKNWCDYQKDGQQKDSKRTASGHIQEVQEVQEKDVKDLKKKIYKRKKGDEKAENDRHKIPPTISMIQAYCIERENGIDCQYFFDYNTSKGWIVGKSRMKDWQAAIRTWEQNNKKRGNGSSAGKLFDNLVSDITKHGTKGAVISNEKVKAAVSSIGGRSRIGMATKYDLPKIKGEFIEAYGTERT